MEELLDRFREERRLRSQEMRGQGKEGRRRLIGYFCLHVPEELLYAAGFVPVRVMSGEEEISEADSLLQGYVCSFVRSCLDQGLRGNYGSLDGLVGVQSCDTVRGVYGIWKRNVSVPFTAFLSFPVALDIPEAVEVVRKEFEELRSKLEEYTGNPITDEALRRAIATYNANRQVLAQLARLRASNPRLLSAREFLEIILAGMVMPKDEHSVMIRQVLEASGTRKELPLGKARVLVTGSVVDDPSLLQLIEDSGAMVVADDLCTGSRYFDTLAPEDGDPLRALAESYFNRIFCPCRLPFGRRKERLLKMVDDYRVEGVIFLLQKFCDPHYWDYPALQKALEDRGIPVLLVECEHRMKSVGQIKTRVQALVEEIIRG